MYFGAPPPDHAEAENAEQIIGHKNPLLYIIALIYTKIHTFREILYILQIDIAALGDYNLNYQNYPAVRRIMT